MGTFRGIQGFADLVPKKVLARSGSVFYSGRLAFETSAPIYVLGANPGGEPGDPNETTVAEQIEWVLRSAPPSWSAYRDQSWKGRSPGAHGMQPRVLHMFESLGVDPGIVPASNLVFVRSPRESGIANEADDLASACWAFHEAVLTRLKPQVVLCLGRTAGNYVRKQLRANKEIDTFIEQNERRWASRAYRSPGGTRIVVATHPSIADWTSPATDPSNLVRRVRDDA
jgi:hypothetical protein